MTRIELLRRQKGLSVKELAALVGVTGGAVSQWENGTKSPRRDRLEALADALDTTVDYLQGKEEKAAGKPDGLDDPLVAELMQLSPSDRDLVSAFVAGLKARRG